MTELVETVQKFDPGDALVELYILEHEGSNYYLQGMHSENITFRDSDNGGTVRDYIPVPLKMDGIQNSSDGAATRPSLVVANSVFTVLDLEAEQFVGSRITRRQTLKKLLTSNPPVEFPIQKFVVDRVASSNRSTTEFELAAPFDLAGLTLPKRKIVGTLCPWEYQGVARFGRGGCTWPKDNRNLNDMRVEIDRQDRLITGVRDYSAGTHSRGDRVRVRTSDGWESIWEAVVDPTEDPGPTSAQWVRLDVCGKRLESCTARFHRTNRVRASTGTRMNLNNTPSSASVPLPFGGFPGSRKFR